jgi:polysaccharide export outer membrane protein
MRRFHAFPHGTYALLVFVPFLIVSCVFAQGHTGGRDQNFDQPHSNNAVSNFRATDSRIGPDDLLDVSVFEASEMNCTVRVSTSGDFSFPMLGPVRAAGLTPEQLESVLEELLRRSYIKDPHVRVFVRELHSHSVSVVGAVKMPGVFQIQGAKPLLEIVSMAQGLSDDAGDTVLITRSAALAEPEAFASGASAGGGGDGDGQSEPRDGPATEKINLKKLLGASDPALNVPVYPGDTVTVTHAGLVYVVGEVHKPGGFVVKNGENVSVLQALALAEGLTRTSSVKQARIIRTEAGTGARAEIPLNLGKVLSGKLPDPILQLDDIVFVPNSLAKGALFRGSEAALVAATGAAIYRW